MVFGLDLYAFSYQRIASFSVEPSLVIESLRANTDVFSAVVQRISVAMINDATLWCLQ